MSDNRPKLEFDLDRYGDKSYLTHNFHPYPAKFVPQIPRELITKLSRPASTVLDPFCGSGTSMVECSLSGRHSVGVDLNPIACLAARVKTTPLDVEQLREATACVQTIQGKIQGLYAASRDGETTSPTEVPHFHNIDLWFEPHIQRELTIAREVIWNVQDPIVRSFLELAFSSIVVSVSNQDSDTRYASVKKDLPAGVVAKQLARRAKDMIARMTRYQAERHEVDTTIVRADAARGLPLADQSIDLVVTSPPYPNTYDYYLYHKFRMLWLGFDHKPIQMAEIGSRNKHSDLGASIKNYQESMLAAVSETARVLRPEGTIAVVVGDAIVRGEHYPMDALFDNICHESGFERVFAFHYPLRRYTRAFTPGLRTVQKQGHVLVYSRSAR